MDSIIEILSGPKSLAILATGYFGMVISERVWYLFTSNTRYDNFDALCSIGLNLISSTISTIGLLVGILLPLSLYIWVYNSVSLGPIESVWLALAVAFIVHDLSYYIEHRISHRVGLFWAFHTIHHSSNSFNHSTAARGFYLDGKLTAIGALAAAFLGVPPAVFVSIVVIKSLYGIWNHASYVGQLGIWERFFATPRNHKIHHANQPEYIDKNYGQVLILWDDLFDSRAHYTVEPVTNNNPLTAQFIGLQRMAKRMGSAQSLSDKLAYLWRPPEWSHLNSVNTSNAEMR